MLSRGKPQWQLPCGGVAGVAPTDGSPDRRSPDAEAQTCRGGITTYDAAGRRRPNVPTRDQPATAAVFPFTPTCSEYAAQALRTHGARRGSWLTIKRLGRCRPNRPTADDPVPRPKFSV
ncbi:MAG: membrane protein insertion efficiency factor YidD [Actinobacteria bacterium]|nr:membrane protein insertion efficiency factor YidD [Actinomycetota bacterium]